MFEVCPTSIGSNRKTGGNGQTQISHLRQVGTLATQQILHILVAFGERVDVLCHRLMASMLNFDCAIKRYFRSQS